jgi:hypothetical protein
MVLGTGTLTKGTAFLLRQWLPSLRLSAFEVGASRRQTELEVYLNESDSNESDIIDSVMICSSVPGRQI